MGRVQIPERVSRKDLNSESGDKNSSDVRSLAAQQPARQSSAGKLIHGATRNCVGCWLGRSEVCPVVRRNIDQWHQRNLRGYTHAQHWHKEEQLRDQTDISRGLTGPPVNPTEGGTTPSGR